MSAEVSDNTPAPDSPIETSDDVQRKREGLLHDLNAVKAEDLIEYRWPLDDPDVEPEAYMIQEQIAEYLDITSFKRKFPDIYRHTCSYEEKVYFLREGLVSQALCDLGLTAVKSEDILELLTTSYPEKYKEVVEAFKKREAHRMSKLQKEEMPSYMAVKITDQGRIKQMFKKAITSCQKYNAELMRERMESRKCSMDMQTYTIQVPRKHKLEFDPSTGDIDWRCPDPYPVAVLPGQYTTSVPYYSDSQLRSLPISTALTDPPDTTTILFPRSPGSIGSGSSIDELLSEPPDGDELELGSDDDDIRRLLEDNEKVREIDAPTEEDVNTCERCGMSDEADTFITCDRCKKTAHITCFDLFKHMLQIVRSYPWQCFDCKRCLQCQQAKNEASLLFCDICDRGFHSYCIGLERIPEGDWCCPLCHPNINVPKLPPGITSPLRSLARKPAVDPAVCPPPGFEVNEEAAAAGAGFVCDFVLPSTGQMCGAVLATKWMLRKHKDATGHKRMRPTKSETE